MKCRGRGRAGARAERRNFCDSQAQRLMAVQMPRQAGTTPTVAQTVQQALALHRQGRLAEAERLYPAALAPQPRPFEAPQFLGVLKLQQSDSREARALLRAAAAAQ